jgi:serine/threonine-protein kinase RsbW
MIEGHVGDATNDGPRGPIDLTLPADGANMRVARLVASGVATAAGFDFEQLEDLRIAVDELCAALVEGGDGSNLTLRFDLDDLGVEVNGSTWVDGTVELDPERYSLSRQILAVVVDEFTIRQADDRLHVHLTKRRASNGDAWH